MPWARPALLAVSLAACQAGSCNPNSSSPNSSSPNSSSPNSPAPHSALSSPPLNVDEVALVEERADDELTRWRRERDERFLEAVDPGEQAEHTRRIQQSAIGSDAVNTVDLFRQGEAIFERRFTLGEGLGTGMIGRPLPGLSRVENAAALGGPDALSCRECHGRGGDDGHGELHQRAWLDGDGRHLATARPRLAPHLAGLGLVALLAGEMTAELARVVESGRLTARVSSSAARVALESKGVSFGWVTVQPGGALALDEVKGVDGDLVVKPFGWKGTAGTLREFVRGALPQHLGLEVPPTVPPPLPNPDNDHDGVPAEVHEGQLTSLVTYLALLDTPVVLPPREERAHEAWQGGAARFAELGCADCHRPELPLRSPRLVEKAPSGAELTLDVVRDNQVPPRPEQFDYARDLGVRLYSDLRRHEMGPGLAERRERGVAPSVFVTRPLWGLGDRGPFYLHDGRARSLRQAILLHGGEAQRAADAFGALAVSDAREVEVFLLSLRRAPQGRILP